MIWIKVAEAMPFYYESIAAPLPPTLPPADRYDQSVANLPLSKKSPTMSGFDLHHIQIK